MHENDNYTVTSKGLGWRQFKAIVKKNLLLKKRRFTHTLIEILSPLVFCLVIASFFSASRQESTESRIYAGRFVDISALAAIARGADNTKQLSYTEAYSLFNEATDLLLSTLR